MLNSFIRNRQNYYGRTKKRGIHQWGWRRDKYLINFTNTNQERFKDEVCEGRTTSALTDEHRTERNRALLWCSDESSGNQRWLGDCLWSCQHTSCQIFRRKTYKIYVSVILPQQREKHNNQTQYQTPSCGSFP